MSSLVTRSDIKKEMRLRKKELRTLDKMYARAPAIYKKSKDKGEQRKAKDTMVWLDKIRVEYKRHHEMNSLAAYPK